MKRIGIFGGTFNPIHIGHLIIAQEVLERLKLERIIFVPCFIPPHKIERNLANPQDRFKMVSLAIRGNPCFQVSDWEIRRKKISFTIETLKYFKKLFDKKARLFFIIGGDNLKGLNKWKEIREVLQLAKVVVVNRPGHSTNNPSKKLREVLIPGIDISSSSIRKRIALGRRVDYFLPCEVFSFIKRKGLYS